MINIKVGDCRETLLNMADGSVNCIVTSPPYFGLRDYDTKGQIGLEKSVSDFVQVMVDVFRECRRVLRDDGTLWLNLGDSYNSHTPGTRSQSGFPRNRDRARHQICRAGSSGEHKRKDMLGVPWRVAFALQEDGWYFRQDIVWHKPNPMPESVRDRCTKSHEYIFLFSKREKYYFDQEAILEDASPNTHARVSQDVATQIGSARAHAGEKVMKAVSRQQRPAGWHNSPYWQEGKTAPGRKSGNAGAGVKNNASMDAALTLMPLKRNKRSVWTVGSEPFADAHFAVYPPALIEPCIRAGCPEGGVVLDPFGGAGTTALVADRLQRDAILLEINPSYAKMAAARLSKEGGMLTRVTIDDKNLTTR